MHATSPARIAAPVTMQLAHANAKLALRGEHASAVRSALLTHASHSLSPADVCMPTSSSSASSS